MARHRRVHKSARVAEIVVPRGFKIREIEPEVLRPIEELDEPHEVRHKNVVSIRRHERAHQRIYLKREPAVIYQLKTIKIPIVEVDFKPFAVHWTKAANLIAITIHNNPVRKVDRWMNKKQFDEKHTTRSDKDHSRALGFGSLANRDPRYSRDMFGALSVNDPGIAADTAIAVAMSWVS